MTPDLTQAEADALLALAKRRESEARWRLPNPGGKVIIPLVSTDGREPFSLDIQKGRINLLKGTYQHRARKIAILARLDFGGPAHRNPDDEEIGVPHLHVYREGYGDKWAFPVPVDRFPNTDDRWKLLQDFMSYCNIVEAPFIDRDLFS